MMTQQNHVYETPQGSAFAQRLFQNIFPPCDWRLIDLCRGLPVAGILPRTLVDHCVALGRVADAGVCGIPEALAHLLDFLLHVVGVGNWAGFAAFRGAFADTQ